VINFLDPPASLFRPRILAEVLRGGPAAATTPFIRPAARLGRKPPARAAP
jgi:hypothetical protein